MSEDDIFKAAQRLRKQDDRRGALDLLAEPLRRNQLDAEATDRAGRAIRKLLDGDQSELVPLSIRIFGRITTSWLVNALAAVAWGRGLLADVAEGEYDNVLQDILALETRGERPDVIVLLPWTQHLFGGAKRASEQRIDDDLAFWQQAWSTCNAIGTRLVQVGYDAMRTGPLGHHLGAAPGGEIALVRDMNAALREHLPPGAYLVDLEQVSALAGRRHFYDARRYFWTKQPFSESGTVRLAEHVFAGIRALTTGPKKALVLDLDNTLWGGVVGETGPLDIELGDSPEGEAYRAFQQYAKTLGERGIVLAVASKNNPADAREPFDKNADMVLTLDDFAAFEASWEPKAAALQRIATTLSLGLDSFVFFDDNPAEREHILQALPEVEVVDVPEDPADYIAALEYGLWFESAELTAEDAERAKQYAIERQRRAEQSSFASIDDYLDSLEIRGTVRDLDETDMQRVVQLLAKTNQFNLTTRRHTREDVESLLTRPGAIALTLRLADRFGDHGLISVIVGVPAADESARALRVDTWLMSCRVIGRTAEQFFFGEFFDRARAMGYERILGEYIPTPKNELVASLYDALSFRRLEPGVDGIVRYALDVSAAPPAESRVKAG